jgi:hypothetical protein
VNFGYYPKVQWERMANTDRETRETYENNKNMSDLVYRDECYKVILEIKAVGVRINESRHWISQPD